MTNKDILNIAMKQSAIDLNCGAEDFLSEENKVVYSKPNSGARKYLELPFDCNLVSYGNNIVASVLWQNIFCRIYLFCKKFRAGMRPDCFIKMTLRDYTVLNGATLCVKNAVNLTFLEWVPMTMVN